jgi:cytoskeletal protein CcmA (bactofilin family)
MDLEEQIRELAAESGAEAAKPEPPPSAKAVLPQLAAMQVGRAAAGAPPVTGGELVIGRGIKVKGSVGTCRSLVVEGELDATVEVESLRLLEAGLFEGAATVADAELSGRFDGRLTVEGRLRLKPSARVTGEIRYRRIVIEDGGELSGEVTVLPSETAAKAGASGRR